MRSCRANGTIAGSAAQNFLCRDVASRCVPSSFRTSAKRTISSRLSPTSAPARANKVHDGLLCSAGFCRRPLTSSTTTAYPSPVTSARRQPSIRAGSAGGAGEPGELRAPEEQGPTPSLPEGLRLLLRHLASSVVVCTAFSHVGDARKYRQGSVPVLPVGLTMSSFTSLSLYPSPVISFNIAMPSRTEAAIAQARHFMIHILSGDASGAQVADVFRSGNAHPESTSRALQSSGCHVAWPQESSVLTALGASQPFIRGPGVLFVLRCRLLEEPLRGLVPVRDHVIVLGEVLEIMKGDAEHVDDSGLPRVGLAYANKQYCQLSSTSICTEVCTDETDR